MVKVPRAKTRMPMTLARVRHLIDRERSKGKERKDITLYMTEQDLYELRLEILSKDIGKEIVTIYGVTVVKRVDY